MRRTIRLTALPALTALLGACATPADPVPDDTVSVQYDPYRFDAVQLRRAALAQCRAKGYARAEAIGDQPNSEAVRWAYATYGCFKS